jgi:hypothetical protein
MLITKNYFMEDSSSKNKNSRDVKLFKRTSLNTKAIETPKASPCESKIKRSHQTKRIKLFLEKEPLKEINKIHQNKANQF